MASRIPVKHRIGGGTTKYAMRLAAERHMPKASASKPKLGFPVPIRIWLRKEEHYNRVKAAFTSADAQRFFHTEELGPACSISTLPGKRTTAAKSGPCTCFWCGTASIFPSRRSLSRAHILSPPRI